MKKAITIDGRHGEGGGQILRTSLALASLVQRPVTIHHIRACRKRPGLRPQHLMAVRAMALITTAQVKGAELGSTLLFFEPRQIKTGDYSFDVGTAGSTSLVLQTMMPALLFGTGESRVVITGGTHVPWSPCFQYLKEVFSPALEQMGCALTLEIEQWGWYPKGGGKIVATISPVSQLQSIERCTKGGLKDIHVLSAVSNLAMGIGERQRDQVIKRFDHHGLKTARMELVHAPSPGTGTLVFVSSRFENGIGGFTALGKKGKPAERVADEACADFFAFTASEAAVDEHLADQLVLYMALAGGHSSFVTGSITPHLKTNTWAVEQLLPVKFDLDEMSGMVSVQGTGFSSSLPA